MKDTAKPMKSIRQAILSTLNTHGELTVDGMLDQITNFDRKTIGANVAQLVTEQLATRRKDDFTGAPAYKITALGKSRIKSDASPVKDCLTVGADKIAEIEAAIDAGQEENNRLRSALKESKQVIESMTQVALKETKSLLGLECEKIELLRENSTLRESQSSGVQRIDVLSEELDTVVSECNRLKSENMALKTLNESMPGFGAAYEAVKSADQQITVEQFLIRVPKGSKPMFVAKSLEKARQQAMRAAKTVGKVEVFAMVPVGHAVRGAVWNQKQA